jgi:periplasmic copper chaperone A
MSPRDAVILRLVMILSVALLSLPALSAGAANNDGPTIDRAWARATPGAATTGAVYFQIESPIADRLIGVTSPVARKAELHTHVEENGLMLMREVEGGLPLPAGQKLELKSGGSLHVMLIDLKQKLKAGDSFPLTVTFEKSGPRNVIVKVERLGATAFTDDGWVGGHPTKAPGS